MKTSQWVMEYWGRLREWCVERAIQLLTTPGRDGMVEGFTKDDVLKLAKKLENYITTGK